MELFLLRVPVPDDQLLGLGCPVSEVPKIKRRQGGALVNDIVVQTLKRMIVDGDFKRNQDMPIELQDHQILDRGKR